MPVDSTLDLEKPIFFPVRRSGRTQEGSQIASQPSNPPPPYLGDPSAQESLINHVDPAPEGIQIKTLSSNQATLYIGDALVMDVTFVRS